MSSHLAAVVVRWSVRSQYGPLRRRRRHWTNLFPLLRPAPECRGACELTGGVWVCPAVSGSVGRRWATFSAQRTSPAGDLMCDLLAGEVVVASGGDDDCCAAFSFSHPVCISGFGCTAALSAALQLSVLSILPDGLMTLRQTRRVLCRLQSLKPGPHRTRQRCSGPVCHRPSASRPVRAVKTASRRLEAVITAPSADGCGEDRALRGTGAGAAGVCCDSSPASRPPLRCDLRPYRL